MIHSELLVGVRYCRLVLTRTALWVLNCTDSVTKTQIIVKLCPDRGLEANETVANTHDRTRRGCTLLLGAVEWPGCQRGRVARPRPKRAPRPPLSHPVVLAGGQREHSARAWGFSPVSCNNRFPGLSVLPPRMTLSSHSKTFAPPLSQPPQTSSLHRPLEFTFPSASNLGSSCKPIDPFLHGAPPVLTAPADRSFPRRKHVEPERLVPARRSHQALAARAQTGPGVEPAERLTGRPPLTVTGPVPGWAGSTTERAAAPAGGWR